MTEVVLYHHVQGLTDGVRSFGDELRRSGHTVHTPDMFEGRVPARFRCTVRRCAPPNRNCWHGWRPPTRWS